MALTRLNYEANQTAAQFHRDPSRIRLLVGPVGCGKSVACCMELFRLMASMPKSSDGKRYSRMLIIRETFPELKSTTLKTWLDLFPVPKTGRLVMGSPIVHYFKLKDIRSEVMFMSIETERDIKKMMSFECTFVWINEARYSIKEVLAKAVQRAGRYPPKRIMNDPFRNGVILDTNPCDDDHWIYRVFEEEKPEDFSVIHYPPALKKSDSGLWIPNEDAENIENLPEGYHYYLKQLAGNSEEWIRVYLAGEYGSSYDGRPVYPEYNDLLHYKKVINPHANIPLTLGWDFGLTPALIIAQVLPTGQIDVLDEITTDYSGLSNFIDNAVTPLLATKYKDFDIKESIGDPSGEYGDQDFAAMTILKSKGYATMAAKTNEVRPRIESVSRRLSSLIDGRPALMISGECKKLRKGFLGGYHFQRINVAIGRNETKYKDMPNKNAYSHPHDALQYICLHYENFKSFHVAKDQSNKDIINRLGFYNENKFV